MYREIQWCLVMSVTVKQMSLESGFERTQRLKIPDVWCSWFHTAGADTAKDCRPKFVAVETTTTRSPSVNDRSLLLPLTKDTGWQKSVRYCGATPCRALYTSRQRPCLWKVKMKPSQIEREQIFTGQLPFLSSNQQHQSTKDVCKQSNKQQKLIDTRLPEVSNSMFKWSLCCYVYWIARVTIDLQENVQSCKTDYVPLDDSTLI